jgi:hypothetical protein
MFHQTFMSSLFGPIDLYEAELLQGNIKLGPLW